jgi:hypothetical protein
MSKLADYTTDRFRTVRYYKYLVGSTRTPSSFSTPAVIRSGGSAFLSFRSLPPLHLGTGKRKH